LLRACTRIRIPDAIAELGSIDLTQVVPAEYRTDSLVVLRNRIRTAVAAVIVEIQLKIDRHKLLTWPVYVAAARARLGCPVTLLVLAPTRGVARWAERAIETGHPGYTLRPIVIEFRQIPRITDARRARTSPELAVLSALAHPEVAVAQAALGALDALTEETQKLYWDVINAGLPAAVRQALEANMLKGYVYQSEFARKYYSQGVEAGRAEGREEGIRAGREEGRAAGLRSAIVGLVCARLPRLHDELASRLSEQPEALLEQIAPQLGKARTGTEVRAVLDRVLGQRPAPRSQHTASPASIRSGRRRTRAHARTARSRR
jgi:flagellar biosynthesis/type III secretory pathway protein FliH